MPTLTLTNTDVDNADAATAAGAHRVDLVNSALKQLILDVAARQASSTILTALAGLSPSADTVGYFTGPSAMATTALTPFGRSLTGAAGLAALQGILGSGTPSSTTFLRGDGTWATPAGGGGGGIADAPNDANYYLRHALAWSAAATVARTGAYSDLSGLPTLGALASQASVNLATQATGNLPVANLAGGSGATSGTFWRGDGTWAVPAAGGAVAGGLVTQTVANGAAVSWPLATEGATLVVDVQGSGANAALTALVQVRTGATLQCWVDDEFAEALWLWRADGTTPTGATQGNDSTGTLVSASGKVLVAAVSGAVVIQNNLGQSRDITVKGLPSGTGSGSFPDPGSNGLLSRTGLNVATPRTIVDAGFGRVIVTFGSGAAGNPTLDVAESALNLPNIGGNLPVSKLASGTGASSTTFWRGDGTWATPAGGGGGSVTSVFGRTGAVVGVSGDYASTLITGTAARTNFSPASANVEANLAAIDTRLATLTPPGGFVVTPIKTASYTAAVGEHVRTNPSGTFTITLPTAPADGSVIKISDDAVSGSWGDSTKAISIVVGGSDTIGSTTSYLSTDFGDRSAVILTYSASLANWTVGPIVGRYGRQQPYKRTDSIKSGSYTLIVTDTGRRIVMAATAATVVTVPVSTAALDGCTFEIHNVSTTVGATVGVRLSGQSTDSSTLAIRSTTRGTGAVSACVVHFLNGVISVTELTMKPVV